MPQDRIVHGSPTVIVGGSRGGTRVQEQNTGSSMGTKVAVAEPLVYVEKDRGLVIHQKEAEPGDVVHDPSKSRVEEVQSRGGVQALQPADVPGGARNFANTRVQEVETPADVKALIEANKAPEPQTDVATEVVVEGGDEPTAQ